MPLTDFILPSLEECDVIAAEIQDMILAEAFDEDYFAIVRGQIEEVEQRGSSRLSSIYSILQRPEWRQKLVEFLQQIKKKLKPDDWRHLCQRLSMLDKNTDLEALFEVVVLGNLLLQLPDDQIELNVPTIGKKNVDAKIQLVDRFIYLEITLLGPSVKVQERRKREEKHGIKSSVGMGIGDGRGRRIAQKLQDKSSQFIPKMPNALILCTFEIWDRMLPGWEEEVEGFPKENIGHLFLFGRLRLGKTFTGDPACKLTKEEEDRLQELLNGQDYYSMGFV